MGESDAYRAAAEALRDAHYVIASTGAGISVESGIPDFRSPRGVWSRYDPEEYGTIEAFRRDPGKVWTLYHELGRDLYDCKPNPAHLALAKLEAMDRMRAVITQNVDNLHQEAGSQTVLEYHGNARWLRCQKCDATTPYNPGAKEYPRLPRCVCDGVLKPDVVMFGEMIPPDAMLKAEALARQCDVIIVVGTSAQVFPAAQLPYTAKQQGAFVIEANTERTDFTESITDAFLHGKAGETLPRLVEMLRELS